MKDAFLTLGVRKASFITLRLGRTNPLHDETTPDGADWCWAALRPTPIEDPPPIYYDQPAGTLFPPPCVMPLSELRDVILEWVRTGQRPTSVDWMPINGLVWDLTEDGQVTVPDPAH